MSQKLISKERRKSERSESLEIGDVQPACQKIVEEFIANHSVAIFSKTWCSYCTKAKEAFEARGVKYTVMELDLEKEGAHLQKALKHISGQKTVPNIYINNKHIGGYTDLLPIIEAGLLEETCSGCLKEAEYDLVVIGGGSGGISAAKEAAKLGKKVALCDYVVPTPLGTKWGLGGTCVNVGCIPKKLMHRAAVLRQDMSDALAFGWHFKSNESIHDWDAMVQNVQNYIRSLNFGYRKTLMENNVKYFNSFASFKDKHTLNLKSDGGDAQVTAKNFLIATGGRPKYPNVKNAKQLCITSDDLFSMPCKPGRTLIVGASYVALECAGFLVGLGYNVTVMVRSILLRGFDQQMAQLIEAQMTKDGVKFVKNTVPIGFEKDKNHGTINVKGECNGKKSYSGVFDTVLLAIGRDPCTENINLSGIGVKLDASTKKIITDDRERTSVSNIFALGDVAKGRPELTPPAIQAGKLLAQRLYGLKTQLMDYKNVPTTVFTPCEYGCVGYTEEDAIKEHGQDKIEVYHQEFTPLEHALNESEHTKSYAKLIVLRQDKEELVIGAHIFSPNAGEIIQGFALGVKMGAKKSHFDDLVGIHPTIAETFTTLAIMKSSGKSAGAAGC